MTVQAPSTATFGGRPDAKTDVAVSGLFIALYAILGILHSQIYKRNQKAGHFFVFNAVIFGFCMSRVTTFVFRILWAQNPKSITIAIVANVLINAGIILLFVVNMNFAQRIVRAYHPRFYDNKPFQYSFLAYYISLVAVLIMVIGTTVDTFETTNHNTLKVDLGIRRFGSVWFLLFTFAPIPIVLVAKSTRTMEPQNFGKKGSLESKLIIVLVTAVILTFSTGIRSATVLAPARPADDPTWFESRASFYIFLASFEIVVVTLLLVTRVDQRFFVPGKAEAEREVAYTPAKLEPEYSSNQAYPGAGAAPTHPY